MTLEAVVAIGFTLVVAAGLGLLLWRVLRMRVTEVKGRPARTGPAEYVSDKDISDLTATGDEPEDKGGDDE